MKNKFLALVVVMCMALTMIPGVAMAAGVTCTDTCGDTTHVAAVGNTHYTDIQEAIKAAAPAGTVELLSDVTVEKWIMFSETKTIGNGNIITIEMNGLTINGNGKTLTINSVESATNGDLLFDDASNLNINNLTINLPNGASGISMKSGTLKNVKFNGGTYAIFPKSGDITIDGCTFATNADALYFEQERDGLTITDCTFNQPDGVNVVLLRGDVNFTNNTVNSGRTVNVVSGSPVVTGNNFNDVRLKVYNDAAATISNNEIDNLVFDDEDAATNATFTDNTLSEAAEDALAGVGATNEITPPAATPKPVRDSIKVTYNGGNSFSTSKSAVPTSVEIDGVPVVFNGDGRNFTVSCVDPDAEWVTVRWNSTSVTVNFKPDVNVVCSSISIPKTGDMPLWAAVLAFFGF